MNKQETHRFTHADPDRTVRGAFQLLSKLPNGWTLDSLEWMVGPGWIAYVTGPEEVVPE